MCGIEDLSGLVEEDIIPEMFIPCPKLQAYMCKCVPLIQKFLYNNYRLVYVNLFENGILQTMAKLNCIEVRQPARKWNSPNYSVLR